MSTTRIAIHGAAGRMGRRLVTLASQDDQLQLVAAMESAEHPQLGDDVGLVCGLGELGVCLRDSRDGDVDVVVDFSVPEAVSKITAICVGQKIPLVVATTGLNDQQQQSVAGASSKIPVVWAPNMSLAVNLTMKLSEIAAHALSNHPTGVDVEIIERHHRYKEDAPSGTALRFGQIIAEATGLTRHVHGRQGRPGQRTRDEIGYHAVRVGDNSGEHTIVFGLLGETIELHVSSASRDCYAQGALVATRWIVGKQPGMYSMFDVLGL